MTVKLALENVYSLFYESPHRELTPFQAAQKDHCPHCNHATNLCRDHGLKKSCTNQFLTVQFIG